MVGRQKERGEGERESDERGRGEQEQLSRGLQNTGLACSWHEPPHQCHSAVCAFLSLCL